MDWDCKRGKRSARSYYSEGIEGVEEITEWMNERRRVQRGLREWKVMPDASGRMPCWYSVFRED